MVRLVLSLVREREGYVGGRRRGGEHIIFYRIYTSFSVYTVLSIYLINNTVRNSSILR